MRRFLLLALAFLVLLPLVAGLGAKAALNSTLARGEILDAVQRATGHAARIDGPIGIAWSLTPAFTVDGLTLLNPPGFSRPEFVSARRVEVPLAVLPFLEGRVEIPSLSIEGADALLERDAQGRGNWLSAPQPTNAPAAPSVSRARTPVLVQQVRVWDARIAWLGEPPVVVRSLSAVPSGGPVAGTVLMNGVPVAMQGDWQAAAAGVKFDGTAEGGGLTLALSGQVGSTSSVVAFQVAAADLAAVGQLAGRALPSLKDVRLVGQWAPAPDGPGAVLRGLRLSSAQGDVAGDIVIGFSPRTSLRGSLVSQRLDLDALMLVATASVAAPTTPAPPAAVPAQPVVEAPHWLLPERELPFTALRRMDADLQWTVAQMSLRGVAYRSAVVHVLLQDGRLLIDPATIVSPAGPVRATVQADAGASPPTAAVVLHASGLDAAGVSTALGSPGAMTGAMDLDVDLHMAGTTPHAMAAAADGHAGLALTDGDIENEVLARLFGTALRGANVPFEPSGRSRVRCLAVRLDAAHGQATVQALALDTSKLRLDGDGQVDLGAETMDLHLRPVLRLGPTTVTVPVRLSGPWRGPRAQADKGVIAPGRFGISIGAAAPDTCGPALATVRQGSLP